MAQSWPFLKADAAASSGDCEPAIGFALLQQGLTLVKDGNLSACLGLSFRFTGSFQATYCSAVSLSCSIVERAWGQADLTNSTIYKLCDLAKLFGHSEPQFSCLSNG